MQLYSSRSPQHVLVGAITFLCLILLLSACTPGTQAAQSQQQPSLFSKMDAFLTTKAKVLDFNGSVLVARNGHILLSKGYGMANADQALANTPTTMFGIGSVTKEFTAMAILILQERGKLHLHDPICTYINPCPQAWRPITIYQLLTHTSGIPSHGERIGVTLTELEEEPLDFKPGTQFSYSNAGYFVLATILQKVSGQAYGAFLQQHIFAPLHLTQTGYDYTQPRLPGLAVGYSAAWEQENYTGTSLILGADGIYSTVGDLYRWDQALFTQTQTLVSKPALSKMFTDTVAICPTAQASICSAAPADDRPATSASPISLRYGYGWCIATVEGSTAPIIYHIGLSWGFRAYNSFYSEDNLTIIVLSNLEVVDQRGIAQSLHQIVTAKA